MSSRRSLRRVRFRGHIGHGQVCKEFEHGFIVVIVEEVLNEDSKEEQQGGDPDMIFGYAPTQTVAAGGTEGTDHCRCCRRIAIPSSMRIGRGGREQVQMLRVIL